MYFVVQSTTAFNTSPSETGLSFRPGMPGAALAVADAPAEGVAGLLDGQLLAHLTAGGATLRKTPVPGQ